jgi:hypothetical protein
MKKPPTPEPPNKAASETPSKAQLEDTIRNRADELLKEVWKDAGGSREEKVERLKQLSALLELRHQHQRFSWQRLKLPLFFVFIAIYALIAWYLLRPYNNGQASVQLEVVVSRLTLEVCDEAELATSGIPLAMLAFNQAQDIRVPQQFQNLTYPIENIKLEVTPEAQLTVNNITLHKGDGLALSRWPGTSGFRLEVFPVKFEDSSNPDQVAKTEPSVSAACKLEAGATRTLESYQANLSGEVKALGQSVTFTDSESMTVTPTDVTSLDFQLANSGTEENQVTNAGEELLDFSLPVGLIRFRDIRTKGDLYDLVSTIKEGSIYIEASNKTIDLREGENLNFSVVQNGLVTSLELLPDNTIRMRFRGVVSGLETGFPDHLVPLMPTRLEWLRAREATLLLLGVFLYILGFLMPLFLGAEPKKGEKLE